MGLAVAGSMSVDINPQKFILYDGSDVLYEPCNNSYP